MSDYDYIRLETRNEVVMYFAPNFEVSPVMKNDVFAADRPRGRGTIARDNQMYRMEISIQGEFLGTDELPQPHTEALQDLFGVSGEVTARDQVNRIKDYLLNVGGPFELYDGSDEYSAYEQSAADYADGVFPTVQPDEFRPSREAGTERQQYMLKMVVGSDPSEDQQEGGQ